MSISLSSHHVVSLLEATQVWAGHESIECEGVLTFSLSDGAFDVLGSMQKRNWLVASAYYVVRTSREFASACNEYAAGERPLASVRKVRNDVIDSLISYCQAKELARDSEPDHLVPDAYPNWKVGDVMEECANWDSFITRNIIDQ